MALIKCPECGKEFSSYADCCPQCGYPTREILKERSKLSSQDDNPDEERPSVTTNGEDKTVVKAIPYESTYVNEDKQNVNRLIKKVGIGIVLIAIVGLIIGYFDYQRNNQDRQDQVSQVDSTQVDHSIDSAEVAPVDTESENATEEDEGNNTNSKILSAYEYMLQNCKQGSEYFLYDITGDGIPELWIKDGGYEAEYQLEVYDKDQVFMYLGGAGHTSYYKGRNYIISYMAHMGDYEISKLTYSNGKIRSKVFKSGSLTPDQLPNNYPKVKEEDVQMYDATNYAPLESAFAN